MNLTRRWLLWHPVLCRERTYDPEMIYLLWHPVLRSERWLLTLPDVGWPIVWCRKPRFQSPATYRLYSCVAPPGVENTVLYVLFLFTWNNTRPYSVRTEVVYEGKIYKTQFKSTALHVRPRFILTVFIGWLGDAAILFGVITARNSNSGKVMFSQVSVILSRGEYFRVVVGIPGGRRWVCPEGGGWVPTQSHGTCQGVATGSLGHRIWDTHQSPLLI